MAAKIADALETARRPADPVAQKWQECIEERRKELAQTEQVLESWDRPWLLRSHELRDRIGIEMSPQTDTDTTSEGMTVQQAVAGSKKPSWCRVLFELVRALRPRSVVELGTNVGISGLYIAAGLTEVESGRLITLEGSPSMSAWAAKNFRELGVDDRAEIVIGDFFDKLDGVLAECGDTIDLAFIDGFHDGEATIEFHEKFKETADRAILVYDDIRWSEGMEQAWKEISNDPCVTVCVDAKTVGICVVGEASDDSPCVHVTWSP